MILRRIIAHWRKQEWTAIGIDFVIVVVGVFIGIQVANWNEGQSDKRALEAALDRLRSEMAANIETMDVVDAEVRSTLAVVQAGSDALGTCRDDPATRRAVNAGLSNIAGTSGLRLRQSALAELTSDARLLSQQSPALRRRLADVQFYTDLAEEEARFYELFPLETRPEANPNLTFGPRQRVTLSYFGIDYSKDRRPLELGAPVSVACQDGALVSAFNTWEGWQQNLPVLTRKMREEYRLTRELIEGAGR
jgi:hypothetical protein